MIQAIEVKDNPIYRSGIWYYKRKEKEYVKVHLLTLQFNDTLTHLDVSWNGFSIFGTESIGKALEVNSTLEVLNLANNRLNDVAVAKLLKGLELSRSLKAITVSGKANDIQENQASHFVNHNTNDPFNVNV